MDFTTQLTNQSMTDYYVVIGDVLFMDVTPVISVFGILGNTLSIIMSKFGKRTYVAFRIYMAALGVFDNLYLIFAFLIPWSRHLDEDSYMTTKQCLLSMFWSCFCSNVSAYTLASLSIDRYLSVCHPIRFEKLRGKLFALIVMFIVISLCAIKNIIYFYYAKIEGSPVKTSLFCGAAMSIDNEKLNFTWKLLELLFNEVIPFFLVFYLNFQIIRSLHRQNQLKDSIRSVSFVSDCLNSQRLERRRKTYSIMIMLITVTFTFFVLTAPFWCYFLLVNSSMPSTGQNKNYLVSCILRTMFTLNSCVNFYLYCLSSSEYRADLKELICSMKKKIVILKDRSQSAKSTRSKDQVSISIEMDKFEEQSPKIEQNFSGVRKFCSINDLSQEYFSHNSFLDMHSSSRITLVTSSYAADDTNNQYRKHFLNPFPTLGSLKISLSHNNISDDDKLDQTFHKYRTLSNSFKTDS